MSDNNTWMQLAACREAPRERESDPWFSPPGTLDVALAEAVCEGCPVVVECGQHADDNSITLGVWGGRSREVAA